MLSINFKDSAIAGRQLFDFEQSVRLESSLGGFDYEGVRNAQDRTYRDFGKTFPSSPQEY